jgi:hypothetical protein
VAIELDLRRQVVARVLLAVHVERRELRVAQVRGGVGVVHAAGDGGLVAAARDHDWPFLPITMAVPVSWHMGSTPPGGDVGVLQQLARHEAVVRRGLGVAQDRESCARWPGRSRCAMSRMASR